ncbi:hypothetical protein M426DRAFT_255943 [Hypoxylon sp. CI-4A]|nr:hypothetical protein M426DRAFT_255943 [Hypoxylon sp. CI-4A]
MTSKSPHHYKAFPETHTTSTATISERNTTVCSSTDRDFPPLVVICHKEMRLDRRVPGSRLWASAPLSPPCQPSRGFPGCMIGTEPTPSRFPHFSWLSSFFFSEESSLREGPSEPSPFWSLFFLAALSARFAKGSCLMISKVLGLEDRRCSSDVDITFFPRDLAIRAADFSSILDGPIFILYSRAARI